MPHFISNAQNALAAGSAPDPAGKAYDDPPDPLIVKGFAPSALATHYFPSILPRSKENPNYGSHFIFYSFMYFEPEKSFRTGVMWTIW